MRVEDKDRDRALAEIDRYLALYPKRDDEQAREVRDWHRRLWVEWREQQLFNRFNGKFKPEDDGQKLAEDALRRENDGDLEDAARTWRAMEDRYKDAPSPDPRVY